MHLGIVDVFYTIMVMMSRESFRFLKKRTKQKTQNEISNRYVRYNIVSQEQHKHAKKNYKSYLTKIMTQWVRIRSWWHSVVLSFFSYYSIQLVIKIFDSLFGSSSFFVLLLFFTFWLIESCFVLMVIVAYNIYLYR